MWFFWQKSCSMVFDPKSDGFYAKVEYGLKLAIQQLSEKMAANNETAAFIHNGAIKHIPAREILEMRQQGIPIHDYK